VDFPKNIMIIEDEVVTQRYIKDILSQKNVNKVSCFNNGEDSIKALEESAVDMILMDINIKGAMDGLRTAKRILEKHRVPLVFVTAHDDRKTFSEALDLSMYGFVSKPFLPKELELAIQIAYKRFMLESEKEEHETLSNTKLSYIKIKGSLVYSFESSTLLDDNHPVKLNAKQILFIELLCENINSIISNEVIKTEVWKGENVTDSSLRNMVYTIRKIIPELPLKSYSKSGYCIKSNNKN